LRVTERVLIFGGTFDPPHLAHVTLPPLVARRLDCRRIVYVPAAVNPLKTERPLTPARHRLAMLRLAVAQVPDAEISTVELDRPPPSYTVETLAALRQRFGPDAVLYLLMGSDQALAFPRWKQWQRILELAVPAVLLRPPLNEEQFFAQLMEVHPPEEARRWLDWSVAVPQMDICATELRRRLAAGEDVRGLIQPPVMAYIQRHGLYRAARSGTKPSK
jgi:nicotinate-nucleotide adenylyltransferase